MVTQVMTREQFYAKYPEFAKMGWNAPSRQVWLSNHPGAAAQWSAIRDVEQKMTSTFGENWRETSGEAWFRAVTDYLDGGFGDNPSPPAGTGTTAPGTAGTPTAPTGSGGAGTVSTAPTYDRNAYESILGVFRSYGLESLAPTILKYVQEGYSGDTVEILLRETPEYKARFAANVKRQAAGLNAISISEYLRLEDEYAAILGGSGLPAGFYDNKTEDFVNWIAGDVSPDELRERVAMAQQAVLSSDPNVRNALSQYYNLGEGDLVAYFLDPSRANTLFQTRRTFGAATVGAAAAQQGLSTTRDRAELWVDRGITGQQAAQGFANVASALPDSERLSSIYDGADVGQTELEDEFLGGNALASQKRAKLVGKEAANFSGSGGVGRSALRKRKRGAY
jgi:hypothetical protein